MLRSETNYNKVELGKTYQDIKFVQSFQEKPTWTKAISWGSLLARSRLWHVWSS